MSGPERHRPVLVQLLRTLPPPLSAVEVGVASGQTSEHLLRELPDLVLYMVDPWLCPSAGTRKTQADYDAAAMLAEQRTEFAGSRRVIIREKSLVAVARSGIEDISLAFIDGCHFYDAVAADLIGWWPKVKPGGILCGHDYHSPRNAAGDWGVKRAVDEFAANVELPVEHMETVWVIRKPDAQ